MRGPRPSLTTPLTVERKKHSRVVRAMRTDWEPRRATEAAVRVRVGFHHQWQHWWTRASSRIRRYFIQFVLWLHGCTYSHYSRSDASKTEQATHNTVHRTPIQAHRPDPWPAIHCRPLRPYLCRLRRSPPPLHAGRRRRLRGRVVRGSSVLGDSLRLDPALLHRNARQLDCPLTPSALSRLADERTLADEKPVSVCIYLVIDALS